MGEQARTKCLIVGAGPVGALAALYAANRGWDVEVYELRGGSSSSSHHDVAIVLLTALRHSR